eukprot:c12173_g1_i1.p1 GENE.c12173_g1_i1~~c12173_g1_i1.p1  ORF type:complete len:303 (-),score=68.82 c12173_g1_i1:130-1038(-)
MATRNRTSQYLNIRHTMRRRVPIHDPEPYRGGSADNGRKSLLASGSVDSHLTQSDFTPTWVDIVDQIHDCSRKIDTKLHDLSKAHTQHLLPGFDDMDDKEQEVQALTTEISRLVKTCEARIRYLSKDGPKNPDEGRVLLNLQTQLATQLSAQCSQFRKSQKAYLSKLKGQQKMESDFVRLDADEEQGFVNLDRGFTGQQERIVRMNDIMLQQRDEEISKITESIEDLAVLFKDLHTMVIDQGTILDRIDFNIEQVQEHTNTALNELKKGEKTQKKNRMMMCIYALLMACGFLMIMLILKHSR